MFLKATSWPLLQWLCSMDDHFSHIVSSTWETTKPLTWFSSIKWNKMKPSSDSYRSQMWTMMKTPSKHSVTHASKVTNQGRTDSFATFVWSFTAQTVSQQILAIFHKFCRWYFKWTRPLRIRSSISKLRRFACVLRHLWTFSDMLVLTQRIKFSSRTRCYVKY